MCKLFCTRIYILTYCKIEYTLHKIVEKGIFIMPSRSGPSLPLPVVRALRKLGSDIRDARLRRRIPTTTMAERASITRPTLASVEKGEPGVQMGTYATVLFLLGMTNRLAELADVRQDATGLQLEQEKLPQRIRMPSSSSSSSSRKPKS